ncbi:hypothetical protein PDJAM_G00194720 [Pangasius djambal]|uniref:Uncharacterized protein n=1 Tax=Pangasius djambal TaxID=1691987 RepID=A0ACC5ZPI6_9TELE|nr:hypothetical protein [Pangasius djambal]
MHADIHTGYAHTYCIYKCVLVCCVCSLVVHCCRRAGFPHPSAVPEKPEDARRRLHIGPHTFHQEDRQARASKGCSDGGGTAEGAIGEDPELSAVSRDRAGPPQAGARAAQAADKGATRAV